VKKEINRFSGTVSCTPWIILDISASFVSFQFWHFVFPFNSPGQALLLPLPSSAVPPVFEATTDLPEAQTAALRLAIAYLCDNVAVLVVSAPSAGASAGGGFIYDWLLRALVMPFLNGYFPFVIFMDEHRD